MELVGIRHGHGQKESIISGDCGAFCTPKGAVFPALVLIATSIARIKSAQYERQGGKRRVFRLAKPATCHVSVPVDVRERQWFAQRPFAVDELYVRSRRRLISHVACPSIPSM